MAAHGAHGRIRAAPRLGGVHAVPCGDAAHAHGAAYKLGRERGREGGVGDARGGVPQLRCARAQVAGRVVAAHGAHGRIRAAPRLGGVHAEPCGDAARAHGAAHKLGRERGREGGFRDARGGVPQLRCARAQVAGRVVAAHADSGRVDEALGNDLADSVRHARNGARNEQPLHLLACCLRGRCSLSPRRPQRLHHELEQPAPLPRCGPRASEFARHVCDGLRACIEQGPRDDVEAALAHVPEGVVDEEESTAHATGAAAGAGSGACAGSGSGSGSAASTSASTTAAAAASVVVELSKGGLHERVGVRNGARRHNVKVDVLAPRAHRHGREAQEGPELARRPAVRPRVAEVEVVGARLQQADAQQAAAVPHYPRGRDNAVCRGRRAARPRLRVQEHQAPPGLAGVCGAFHEGDELVAKHEGQVVDAEIAALEARRHQRAVAQGCIALQRRKRIQLIHDLYQLPLVLHGPRCGHLRTREGRPVRAPGREAAKRVPHAHAAPVGTGEGGGSGGSAGSGYGSRCRRVVAVLLLVRVDLVVVPSIIVVVAVVVVVAVSVALVSLVALVVVILGFPPGARVQRVREAAVMVVVLTGDPVSKLRRLRVADGLEERALHGC